MLRKYLFLLTMLLLLILGGCSNSSGASAGKIIPPTNQISPLAGTWRVQQELGSARNTEGETRQWTGDSVQFAAGTIAFGGQVWDHLSYKIKRVNADDYILTKYTPVSGIKISEGQKTDVITIYASSNFLGEVMKIDDKKMLFFVQDKGLLLKKISDQTNGNLSADNAAAQNLSQIDEGTSGMLLGLRKPSASGYTYRTLWIAASYDKVRPVLETEQIFFPRTSGFWELNVQDISSEGETGTILTAHNAGPRPVVGDKEGQGKKAATDSAFKVIDYIGNDYVALEKNTEGMKRLQVLPVDKLSSSSEIKISDLVGDKGLDAYLTARKQTAAILKEQGAVSIDSDASGENFGLVRKNGHWVFVGRINYQNGGVPDQEDFNLKIIPPSNLIFYDTLVLSWHNIKDRVPDAVDAFTAPDKDIALVKTKNKLILYRIGSEQLAENPLAEIDLQEGETVIMAEWATRSYVDSWERSFLAYGAKALTGSAIRIR